MIIIIMKLPPITLSKFLNLVGVSFLDHLTASTRRRTIPPRVTESEGSKEVYRSSDLVKAMAISMQDLYSYREACRLLKQSIDTSRAYAEEQERRMNKKNPEYFREFRESDSEIKELIKDQFRMVKVYSKLETSAAFNNWKSDLLKMEQETLKQHLDGLKKDIMNLSGLASTLAKEKAKVIPRRDELRQQLEEATQRQHGYELVDKEQLANLAEAAEEQGAQIEHYESVKDKKAKELAEIRARVEQLQLVEKTTKERIIEAEKTVQKHQYVRVEDLNRAKDTLSIIQAIHRWEPVQLQQLAQPTAGLQRLNKPLEFIYDRTLKVTIDITKIGKDPNAVQLSEYLDGNTMDFNHVSQQTERRRPRLAILALMPKKPKPVKEYAGLLRDFTTMIATKYKAGTAISKILNDISQFWQRISLIRRDVELVRVHHVVDLVAGSVENLKELEGSNDDTKSGGNTANNIQCSKRQIAGSTVPIVVLDIRVRFTGPIIGGISSSDNAGGGSKSHSSDHNYTVDQDIEMDDTSSNAGMDRNEDVNGKDRGQPQGQGREHEPSNDDMSRSNNKDMNHPSPSDSSRSRRDHGKDFKSVNEPVKFYLWFTFTLNDILSFPGPNSFTWRLEMVYGNMDEEYVAQAIGPIIKKGGYDVLRETCLKVNQLLRI
ncbi:Spc7 kinetochore protein-domain-containing protein [Lobosporangium transversale]|uniref:Spc7 kinetochore protein-domain-containing protein n=1 Tax=Lobosporangium transversale TaxID=64571 RepID=A0A1Y2GJX7_9FUNG|nr:Spc7 kinetochore protein-domain-containing protein [Lobosporangium transversale]ORZ13028.1 Spc7 kinetochore protein-domain-containing protein [Lobosporangium transversale]|eukprot:XP_021880377.1 Spc7 kinetochore protein-domain-containing protein [Lobosporangium transversale]